MPSKKKKYNARFPPARIKKIMQADEDVGKVAAAVPVIISRSLELFIDSLIERTATITRARNAKTLSTSHIKQAIHSEKTFDFLRDLVKAVPDHQVEDDGDGAVASGSGSQERKPKPAKPRKPREEGARGRGRPRKVKPEPEVKKESSSEEDDEATESDEEQTSQEEMVISDQASNSPAYNPVQTSAQQSSNPLQSRLEPPSNSIDPLQNPASLPQNTKVPLEQMSGTHFPRSPMAQSPFQPQPFQMHNYPYPQFVLPPGAPPFGLPPNFMPPSMNNQHPPQMSHMPQGMMPFQPFIPRHMPFSGNSDGQATGSNSSQTVPYMAPGHSENQPATTASDQPQRLPIGQANMTSHHDSNMPLDMSISGKSRQQSESESQESSVPDRPVQLPTIPVPQGYPAPTHQGYSFQAHDQAQGLNLFEQSSNPAQLKQPSTQIGNQLVGNQAISNYSSTQSQKGSNSESPVSQKNNNAADIPRDTTVVKPDTQEKDKGLVSFPGLSNIMKMNTVKSVINNDDDDDYDT